MTEQDKKAARRQLAKLEDYQRCFGSPHGKRVLYDLIANHYVMNPLPKDGNERDRAEGERNVVLRILTKLKVDYTKVQKVLEEADDNVHKQNTI